jgi:hypothetical protein
MVLRPSNCQLRTRLGLAVLLAGALIGCGGSGAPTAPTPTAIAAPVPSPTPPRRTGSLSGAITEITSTGSKAVEGVTIEQMSCDRVNCGGDTIVQTVLTGSDGAYRFGGLYEGALNFVWISKEGYVPTGPAADRFTCEGCDRIVTITGDTRLDIELVRR